MMNSYFPTQDTLLRVNVNGGTIRDRTESEFRSNAPFLHFPASSFIAEYADDIESRIFSLLHSIDCGAIYRSYKIVFDRPYPIGLKDTDRFPDIRGTSWTLGYVIAALSYIFKHKNIIPRFKELIFTGNCTGREDYNAIQPVGIVMKKLATTLRIINTSEKINHLDSFAFFYCGEESIDIIEAELPPSVRIKGKDEEYIHLEVAGGRIFSIYRVCTLDQCLTYLYGKKWQIKVRDAYRDDFSRVTENIVTGKITREEMLRDEYNRIRDFFSSSSNDLLNEHYVPIREIVENAPRYFAFIRMIEDLNTRAGNGEAWLAQFLRDRNLQIDISRYRKWKSYQTSGNRNEDETYCPASYIMQVYDLLVDILRGLGSILVIDFVLDEEALKESLRTSPMFAAKLQRTGEVRISGNSLIIEILRYLTRKIQEKSYHLEYLVDTVFCLQVYRKIEESGLVSLLTKKKDYIEIIREIAVSQSKLVTLKNRDEILDTASYTAERIGELAAIFRSNSREINRRCELAQSKHPEIFKSFRKK